MLYINSELFAYIAKKLDYHVKARKPHIHIICEMLDIKEKGIQAWESLLLCGFGEIIKAIMLWLISTLRLEVSRLEIELGRMLLILSMDQSLWLCIKCLLCQGAKIPSH